MDVNGWLHYSITPTLQRRRFPLAARSREAELPDAPGLFSFTCIENVSQADEES